MKKFLSLLTGLAIVATASTADAQVDWAAGAPGGTSGGSIDFTPASNLFLDTGIPAAQVGGNRGDAANGVPSAGSDYTITAWINSSVDNGFGEAADNYWWLGTGNQGLHLGVFDTNKLRSGHWGSDISGTSIVPSNTWVHVAFAFDADGGTVDAVTGEQNGTVEIFLNGVSEGAPVDQRAPNFSDTNLILGGRNAGTQANSWDGLIDDVAVFTSVLSAADIAAMASDSSQAIALGAAAYYDFEDDQTGETAANAGTLGTDLTGITGTLPPAPPAASWVAGAPGGSSGGAASFAGGNLEFLQTDIPAITLGDRAAPLDYTVSAWINSSADDGSGNATSDRWWFGTGSQGVHLGVFSPTDGSGIANGFRHGHWGADNSGTTMIPANTWVHATFVYDADGGTGGTTGLVSIYRDGQLESASDSAGPNRANTDLIIGSRNGGAQSWNGSIDDVAIFTTALSAGDVASLHSDTTQAVALGAVSYYDFEDDQAGTTVANSGSLGSALDGMLPNNDTVLKGDVDLDGGVTFLDIQPFIGVLSTNGTQPEADCDCNGEVNFLDIQPFITILSTQ